MSNRPETRPGFYFSGDDDPWIAGLFRDTERVWEGVTRIAGTIDEVIAESETPTGAIPPEIGLHDGDDHRRRAGSGFRRYPPARLADPNSGGGRSWSRAS